jgi:hypothetical protein
VVELFGAFGDFGGVGGHRGDGDGRGLDGLCGRFDGRPAGRIGTGSGGLVDIAGHVHFIVEARSGSAAVEVHLAGSNGHSHGLLKVSTCDRAHRFATLSLTGPSVPQMSEYALSAPPEVHCRAMIVVTAVDCAVAKVKRKESERVTSDSIVACNYDGAKP